LPPVFAVVAAFERRLGAAVASARARTAQVVVVVVVVVVTERSWRWRGIRCDGDKKPSAQKISSTILGNQRLSSAALMLLISAL
jgi:hypothetical protein